MKIFELEKWAEEILHKHQENDKHEHDWNAMRESATELYFLRTKMIKDGLIKLIGNGITELENKGIEFTTYQSERDKSQAKEHRAESKEDLDFKNAERVYKSYPTTRLFAWTAFIISLLLLFLKLLEVFHIWPY